MTRSPSSTTRASTGRAPTRSSRSRVTQCEVARRPASSPAAQPAARTGHEQQVGGGGRAGEVHGGLDRQAEIAGDRPLCRVVGGQVHLEVYVDGVAVPAEAWQSRRARELLRLLVCRRGRTIPRLEFCELLWPDDDPDRTGHRLSVLLSIVRGVAGPQAVVADQACVALDSTKVQVDVEQFLADVDDAVALHQRSAATDARTLLAEAVRRYTDKPFADAPYDDATRALREEARAAQRQALRLLAELCRHAGEDDQAAMYLRRLLAADPYDEDAHRRLLAVLVEAGQHGQARLGAARYRAAMADLGLAPPSDTELDRSWSARDRPRPARGRSGPGVHHHQIRHADRPRLVVRDEDAQLVAGRPEDAVVEDLVERAADRGVDGLVHDRGAVQLHHDPDARVVAWIDPVRQVRAGMGAGGGRQPRGVELLLEVPADVGDLETHWVLAERGGRFTFETIQRGYRTTTAYFASARDARRLLLLQLGQLWRSPRRLPDLVRREPAPGSFTTPVPSGHQLFWPGGTAVFERHYEAVEFSWVAEAEPAVIAASYRDPRGRPLFDFSPEELAPRPRPGRSPRCSRRDGCASYPRTWTRQPTCGWSSRPQASSGGPFERRRGLTARARRWPTSPHPRPHGASCSSTLARSCGHAAGCRCSGCTRPARTRS